MATRTHYRQAESRPSCQDFFFHEKKHPARPQTSSELALWIDEGAEIHRSHKRKIPENISRKFRRSKEVVMK